MTPCGREYIYFLYDLSGGRGKAPAKWPPHPGGERLHGYAGGIGPHNAAEVVGKIDSAGPFWLDMEGGVRDAQDRLDLEKVRAVCAAVYGD
jgi:phosphoribosylanthranilate isomerase